MISNPKFLGMTPIFWVNPKKIPKFWDEPQFSGVFLGLKVSNPKFLFYFGMSPNLSQIIGVTPKTPQIFGVTPKTAQKIPENWAQIWGNQEVFGSRPEVDTGGALVV